jgi:CheY-like chemotaxis protein
MAYRILIVEDEADTREMLAIQLGLDGYHVDTVANGHEALQRLAGGDYAVILSDFWMPGMNGEALYGHIQLGWPHRAPRVLFMTADRPAGGIQATHGGAPLPTLTKPFSLEQLRQAIARVIARDI